MHFAVVNPIGDTNSSTHLYNHCWSLKIKNSAAFCLCHISLALDGNLYAKHTFKLTDLPLLFIILFIHRPRNCLLHTKNTHTMKHNYLRQNKLF